MGTDCIYASGMTEKIINRQIPATQITHLVDQPEYWYVFSTIQSFKNIEDK